MKKNIKKTLIVCVSLMLCLFLFTGCGKKNDTVDEPSVTGNEQISPSPESTDSPGDDVTVTSSPDTEATTDVTASPNTAENTGKMKELPIYTINDESLEAQPAVAMVPEESEVTAEFIVTTVVRNLEEHSLTVGIDSVTVDKERVIVSFLKDTAPLTTVGSGVEATILDCISGSLLDNLDTCKQVIFRAEGKSYESGHIVLELDEAYAWK